MRPYYIDILRSELESRKAKNSRYSLRAFAGLLKIHPSALSRILANKQPLSVAAAEQAILRLNLDPKLREPFIVSVAQRKYREALSSLNKSVELDKEKTALRESEERFRDLFDSLEDSVKLCELIRDEDGRPIDVIIWRANAAWERLTGRKAEEIVGKQTSEWGMLENDWLELFARAVDTGTPLREESFAKRYNRWFRTYVVGTEQDRFMAIFTDITESKNAELAAKASEARLRQMFTKTMIPMCIWETEGPIIDANDAFLKLIGYSREDLSAGKINWRSLTPPQYAQKDAEALEEIRSSGFCTPYRKQYRHKDGHLVSILIAGGNFDEKLNRGVLFTVDLSEKLRTEAELEKAKMHLDAVANFVPDLLWRCEAEGSASWVNKKWLDYTGQTLDQAVGWGWLEPLHIEDRNTFFDEYSKAISACRPFEREARIQNKTGKNQWFLVRVEPSFSSEGRLLHFYGAATNIQNLKDAFENSRRQEVCDQKNN